MKNRIPDEIAKVIKDIVFIEAERINYLARSRNDNGGFLDQLVLMPEIGGKLSQYMKKAEVRTYIKDAILNRYSKDKTQQKRPDNTKVITELGLNAIFIECDKGNSIDLYRSIDDNCFVVITDGTVLKWETALRKALSYIAEKPFSQRDASIKIILVLFARCRKITPSDIHQLSKTLSFCNAIPYIYGDSL